MEKLIGKTVVIFTLLLSFLRADVIVIKTKEGHVSFENGVISGTIHSRGYISSVNLKSIPGTFHAPVRNRKGQGIANTMVDGHLSGWPWVFFNPDSLKMEMTLMEEGPIRAVVVAKTTGTCKDWVWLPKDSKLEIERTFVIRDGCPFIGTTVVYRCEKPMNFLYWYPAVPLGMRLPGNKEMAESFRYAVPGEEGEVAIAKEGTWLKKNITVDTGWIQFYLPVPGKDERNACLGYLLPDNGEISGITRSYKSGDEAFTFCEFSYKKRIPRESNFTTSMGYLFTDTKQVKGEFSAAYYARVYNPGGSARGIEIKTKRSEETVNGKTKSTYSITFTEKLGIERKREVVEAAIDCPEQQLLKGHLYAGNPGTAGGKEKEMKFQLKNNDPSSGSIIFEVPVIPAEGSAEFRFVTPAD
jgi:hypothetical protein